MWRIALGILADSSGDLDHAREPARYPVGIAAVECDPRPQPAVAAAELKPGVAHLEQRGAALGSDELGRILRVLRAQDEDLVEGRMPDRFGGTVELLGCARRPELETAAKRCGEVGGE